MSGRETLQAFRDTAAEIRRLDRQLEEARATAAPRLAGDDRVVFYDKNAIHRHLSERNGREAWAEQNGPISIKTELGEKILQAAQRAKGQRLL